MTKPIISVISPAINVAYWSNFYLSLQQNSTPWEIVFVGPNTPDFSLPENFRHIKTSLKPAQCLEIAAMEAIGKYLVVIPDDVRVYPESLHWAYIFKRRLPPFSVVGSRYGKDGEGRERNDQSTLLIKEPTSPVLPICGMVKKSEWVELGGIDSEFIGCLGDADLYLRCIARGGYPFISPNSLVYERDADPGEGLAERFRDDHHHLQHQWVDYVKGKNEEGQEVWKAIFRKQRRDPIIPFDHKTIMEYNQGNVKGWI